MPTDAYFTRPLKTEGMDVPPGNKPVLIASLGSLPAGAYALFAKVIVVTRVDSNGEDSALAHFSLEAGGRTDQAMCALWHSSDRGSLQPAETVSVQLMATIKGPARKRPPAVKLFCRSDRGILELKDLVLSAIKVDSITEF